MPQNDSAEKAVRDIRRKTRRKFSAEEKIRLVLEGLRGEESIASLCRREGIAANCLRARTCASIRNRAVVVRNP
jgi:transposase